MIGILKIYQLEPSEQVSLHYGEDVFLRTDVCFMVPFLSFRSHLCTISSRSFYAHRARKVEVLLL